MRKIREDLCEISTPTVAHDEVWPLQLQAGDKGAICLEYDLRVSSERLANEFPVVILIGWRERCRTGRFQRGSRRHRSLPCRQRQSLNLLEKPVQECRTHRWTIQACGKASGDIDRKSAGTVCPRLVNRLLVLFNGCFRGGFQGL